MFFVLLVFCTLSFKSQYDMSMCVGVGVLTLATAGTLKLWFLNTTIHLIDIHKQRLFWTLVCSVKPFGVKHNRRTLKFFI